MKPSPEEEGNEGPPRAVERTSVVVREGTDKSRAEVAQEGDRLVGRALNLAGAAGAAAEHTVAEGMCRVGTKAEVGLGEWQQGDSSL
jgi:hypothetical protein